MANSSSRSTRLRRALAGALAGAVTGWAVGSVLGPVPGVLVAWSTFALVSVTWVLLIVWPMDADQTRRHARGEDPGRRVGRLIAVVGSLASLAAVVFVLFERSEAHGWHAFALAAVALVSVASSWALVHTDYMLHVARVFYADPIGGIEFNQAEAPMYTDFIYFAVSIGIAYQVADTNVTRNDIRRIVIAQSVLAFLFGAVILATVINLVAGLG